MSLLGKLFGRAKDAAPTPAAVPAPVPAPAPDWIARGNEALQKWDLPAAAECYRQAAEADPANPLARLNQGFVALEQGQAAQAIALLTQALALRRAGDQFAADAHFLLGRAHRRQRDARQALAAFEAAAAANPKFAEPLEEAAALLMEVRQPAAALPWAQRRHQLEPGPASALALAQALCELRRFPEALEHVDAALAQDDALAMAWAGRGEVLLGLGRGEEALAAFERAMAIAGPTPQARINTATALARVGRAEEAVQRLQQVLDEDPANRDAAYNQLMTLLDLLRMDEALAAARRALAHHPQDPDLRWALTVASLLAGDFETGWREHECRWQSTARAAGYDRPAFDRPSWLGQADLAGKTILLFPEQGLGDSLQFLRFVPAVAARAGKVLLQLQDSLVDLAAAAPLPANCEVLRPGLPLPPFDYQTPLMSLPLALGLKDEAGLRMQAPYLRADAARIAAWKERLARAGEGWKVGITWSGNPEHRNDHNRSIPLEAFRAIEAPGCRFVSLQPQVRATDQAALQAWPELLQWGPELRSFLDTAALMEALDAVVCVDTSVAHLAGALGRPLFVLLPFSPDWRWLLQRADSPWYPSATLYRQPVVGDWASVLARVRADLSERARAPR